MQSNKAEELAIKKLEDEKIYRKLTINMQNKMAKFKDGKSTKNRLNDQLIINISSLCKFLRKNEMEKIKENELKEIRKNKKKELEEKLEILKKLMLDQEKADRKKREKEKGKKKNKNELNTKKLSEEMLNLRKEKGEIEEKIKKIDEEDINNQSSTILDVFVPYSRLTKSIQNKLESLNEEIPEEEGENDNLSFDGDNIDLDNSLEHDKIADLIADEDADNPEDELNANTDFLTNDNLSISLSLYNKPVGFDEFKQNDSGINIKKSSLSDKDNIKISKVNEQIMPEINKEE